MTDNYRNKIKHAAWTWREEKVCHCHRPARNKDRQSGRNDKRAARQMDRTELLQDLLDNE